MARIARLIVMLLVVGAVVFGGIALAAGNGDTSTGKGRCDHYREHDCKHHHKKPGPGCRDKGPRDREKGDCKKPKGDE